jgi:hypothetical protein
MSKSKHTEAQMIAALKQVEAARKVEDVACATRVRLQSAAIMRIVDGRSVELPVPGARLR